MATKSKFGKLNIIDWVKGLLVAMGTGVLFIAQQVVDHWAKTNIWDFAVLNPKNIAMAAIGGGLIYLVKNLGENSKGQLLKKEPQQ